MEHSVNEPVLLVTRRSPEDFTAYDSIESAAAALQAQAAFVPEEQYWRQEAALALASLAAYYQGAGKIERRLPALRQGYRAIAAAAGPPAAQLPSDKFIDRQVDRFVAELCGDNGGLLAAELAELFDQLPPVYAQTILCRPRKA